MTLWGFLRKFEREAPKVSWRFYDANLRVAGTAQCPIEYLGGLPHDELQEAARALRLGKWAVNVLVAAADSYENVPFRFSTTPPLVYLFINSSVLPYVRRRMIAAVRRGRVEMGR